MAGQRTLCAVSAAGHALLTRFNLAGPREWGPSVHLDPGWLERRLQVFATYCAPIVRARTSGDFVWIVFVDPAAPSGCATGS
jgi:hypothetical protein